MAMICGVRRRKVCPVPTPGPLRWAPPGYPDYSGYTTVNIANDGSNRTQNLSTTTDYKLVIDDFNPTVANLGGLTITGGRNVVIIGGRMRIENIAASPSQSTQTALKLRGGAGTFHIEGLDIGGRNCNDAIAMQVMTGDQASSVIQIQNCRIQNAVPVGHTLAEGFHPDCIQFQDLGGFAGEFRIDKTTFVSVYQGIYTIAPYTNIKLYRLNCRPIQDLAQGKTPHFMFWQEASSIVIDIPNNDVWVEENLAESNFTFQHSIYPQNPEGRNQIDSGDVPTITTDGTGTYATYPGGSNITGRIYKGVPPGGDYCPAGVAGIGYTSPGYM